MLNFFKIKLFQKILRNTIKVSFSLDPYQDQQNQHSVGPDLGPNCLQRFSAVAVSKERVKNYNNAINFFSPPPVTTLIVCLRS